MLPRSTLSFLSALVSTLVFVSITNGQHYAITGVHTGINPITGAAPYRRNVLDLQKDMPSWSLYVMSLAAMQIAPESDPLSYYQIAGIHGRPFLPWDNSEQVPGGGWLGYCTHNSVLFPSWHRPYLALFEQVLASYAQRIAKQYPKTLLQTYRTAADNLRMPYWDWATDARMPDFVNYPTIRVITPTGEKSITNPFYQYKFQSFPFNPELFPPLENDGHLAAYPQTVRNPDEFGGPSNSNKVNSRLSASDFRGLSYYALTKTTDYDSFASSVVWGPSIENVHNIVHLDIGGQYGHMSMLSYSAWDPIFWLHHVNVDRMTALYQTMNPSTYVTPFNNIYGTFSMAENSNDTATTPLTPFSSNSKGDIFTSTTAQSLASFGYSYPEIQYWNQSPAQLRSRVISTVNSMYGPRLGVVKRHAGGSRTTEWSAAVSVSKSALGNQRFIIRLFLGEVPADPNDWPTSATLVGSFPVMPPPVFNNEPTQDLVVHNELSLVQGLADNGLDGQDVETTVAYLKDNLKWKIQTLDNSDSPVEECESLVVIVQQDVVILGGSGSELPVYSDVIVHPKITERKAGGYTVR